jgi:hypothetical protein
MKKNFKSLNEEIDRIKTLMFETDNIILNNIPLNESVSEETDETMSDENVTDEVTTDMDEAKFKVDTDSGKVKYKTDEGKFKIVKIGDNQFKLKGKGAGQFLDDKGEITKDAYDFISNALPKIGSSLDTDKVIVRLGNKERNTADVDKIFFTVVPKEKVYAIKDDKTLTSLKDTDLEKKPEQKSTDVVTPTPTSTTPKGTTPTGTTPTGKEAPKVDASKKLEDKDILGKKLLDLSSLKLKDYTTQFHEKGYKAGFSYKVNEENKDVYRFDKNGVVTAIFKRNEDIIGENFDMNHVFVNPLLFESAMMSEDYYQCVGSCGNQTKMTDKFTTDVDSIIGGKETKDEGPWSNYPCITKNSLIKKKDHPKFGVVYEDLRNRYFSNGRYADLKTKKIGSYKCDGDKITVTQPANVETKKAKYSIVTDKDLMGQTGIMANIAGAFGADRGGIKGVVDALDSFYVTEGNLNYIYNIIKSLDNKFYYDEGKEIPEYITATQRFLQLYTIDENGDDLVKDIMDVQTQTLGADVEKLKEKIVATIGRQSEQPIPDELKKQSGGTEATA